MNGEFRLGTWLVHSSLNAISQNGVTLHLEPKVMQVLLRLAQQPGELVSKQTLLQDVWRDTFVTDDALKRCISELRHAFEDEAREPRIIETIPKRGYRLLVAPEEVEEPTAIEARGPATAPPTKGILAAQRGPRGNPFWRLSAGLAVLLLIEAAVLTCVRYLSAPETTIDSIAIMPFVSKGTDSSGDLGDGITAGLIESLSQVPQLRVMSRNAVSRYKGKEVDLQTTARTISGGNLLAIEIDPWFDNIRSDPRFTAFLQRMGLPASSVEAASHPSIE